MIYAKKRAKSGGDTCVPSTLTKNSLNGQKKKRQKKLPPPLPVKKGPCARLLPNVGVPKILPDRKFPILRCVLKSRCHPNAVTVILLTLIAFLHPSSLSFILSLCPSLTLLYLWQGAGLCWFAADNVRPSCWDRVFRRAVIADSEAHFSGVTGATIWQKSGTKHMYACSLEMDF